MKKAIGLIFALVIVSYFAISQLEDRAQREAERAETDRREQATKTAVSDLASRLNAVTDWEAHLSKGQSFRFAPILTIELERLWLGKRPILFLGAISDIAGHGASRYTVLVERSIFGSWEYMFETELQLSLISEKNQIDHLLDAHPDLFKDFGFNDGVAVVARIESIRTTYYTGEDGTREVVKVGDGELLEISFTGDVLF